MDRFSIYGFNATTFTTEINTAGHLTDHHRAGLWRRFLSWFGNAYARAVIGLQVRDTTAGLASFQRAPKSLYTFARAGLLSSAPKRFGSRRTVVRQEQIVKPSFP